MSLSITDYIEIVKVDDLYRSGVNKFEIIRTPEEPTRIKDIVGRYKINSSTHKIYISDNFNLKQIAFTDILERNTILFFINIKINVDHDVLKQRLRDIWQTRAGVSQQGNESQEKIYNEFPIQMPSRNKIFR